MDHLRHPPTSQHLDAALEATCDALSVLHVIDARSDDHGWVRGQAPHAINSLRNAIVELRAARGTDASALALGFASATASATPDGPVEPVAHSTPRRTT